MGKGGLCAGAYRVQETAQDALKLDLQAGGRPGSWKRAVRVHNHRAISPVLESKLFKL